MKLSCAESADGLRVWQADLEERAALIALRDDDAARDALTRALRDAGFDGLFWECRRITGAPRAFSFAIVDSPRVARLRANWSPFGAALGGAPAQGAVAFDNLGGKSRLVAPTPDPGLDGAHLAAFLRSAPDAQIHAVWRRVAEEALRWIDVKPLWLSTSGLGVSWLHVRLDPRPKYYTYRPFRDGR